MRDERHKKSKHFIVLYHPESDSFNAAVTAKYCAVVEENNQEAILRDLYRMSARDLTFDRAMVDILARL